MKLLLTNDDGIDADGLQALHKAALPFGDILVAAPAEHQSGCSHTTTTGGRGIRIEERGTDRFAIHGTPADCVRVGLLKLAPKADWILSGVNHGGNLGADVYYSGTVAAVREAVLHGWPGIAFSHYKKELAYDWKRISVWTNRVLGELLTRYNEPGTFWNVNMPHLTPDSPDPEIVYCKLDPHPLPLSYRHEDGLHYYNGDYHNRQRTAGCDVDVCFGGRIAATKIRLL